MVRSVCCVRKGRLGDKISLKNTSDVNLKRKARATTVCKVNNRTYLNNQISLATGLDCNRNVETCRNARTFPVEPVLVASTNVSIARCAGDVTWRSSTNSKKRPWIRHWRLAGHDERRPQRQAPRRPLCSANLRHGPRLFRMQLRKAEVARREQRAKNE